MKRKRAETQPERLLPGSGPYTCKEFVSLVRLEQQAQSSAKVYKRYMQCYVSRPEHKICRRCGVAHHPHLPCVVSSDDERDTTDDESDSGELRCKLCAVQESDDAQYAKLFEPGHEADLRDDGEEGEEQVAATSCASKSSESAARKEPRSKSTGRGRGGGRGRGRGGGRGRGRGQGQGRGRGRGRGRGQGRFLHF